MFTHLHVHSHYSLLDGLAKIDELVLAAKERGFNALALTDSGAMYGAIEFYEECLKQGIKPIIGFEAYVAPGSRHEKLLNDDRAYHLVLFAENYDGYRNLMKLSSIGHLEGLHQGKPRIDKAILAELREGIIALSGCMSGEIAQLLHTGDRDRARAVAQEYKEIFDGAGETEIEGAGRRVAPAGERLAVAAPLGRRGNPSPTPSNFFLELGDHPALPSQVEVNNALIELGRELDIPLVVTRDVHYLNPEDAEAQDILTCIRDGRKFNEPDRPRFTHVDRSLARQEEIAARFSHVPEALENAGKIAERCNLEIPLNLWHFPAIKIPEGKTADQELAEEAEAGLATLVPEVTPEMKTRLAYELDIITKKGYAPYFLTVADFIKWARSQGIITTTRGSAAGSLVSFSIGITTVNPLYFKLPFERFLNPHRPSPPDVDADFADNRRDEVIAYVTQKYGEDKVAQIITFGTMAARASVRDAGRALGFSYGFCDHMAKLIPFGAQGFPMTIARALQESSDLKELYEKNEDAKRLIDVAQKIEGCARHTSIHAAGVVISPEPLTNFTPVQREVGGEKITTQYEMYSVEKAGVLKMDFLGIRNLSILGRAVELVKETYGIEIDLIKLTWDDKKTYDMLARGETVGVFQLSGSGMTRYLKELRPSSIFDIMAMISLFRPGPIESIPEFIKRKHNPELIEYLDDRLKDILDQSYGVITYQDDVLLTAIKIAGYTWDEADKLRKAMGKKIPAEMAKQKEKFIKGCVANGVGELKAVRLWQLIEPFAAYGFNKSHGASYAVVAYQTAYLKANYPVLYMTAVLSAESDDTDKIAEIVHECERMGIAVLPPDVNESNADFTAVALDGESGGQVDKGSARIRFGLTAIKNIGAHIVGAVISERNQAGRFTSIENFLERVQDKDLNKKSLESLIKCGAMDSFGERGALLANADAMLTFAREFREEKNSNQSSLFGGATSAFSRLQIKEALPASRDDKLTWEKELLGLYITSHPFAELAKILDGAHNPVSTLEAEASGSWVTLCGLLTDTKKKITKKGDAMLFASIQDLTGTAELLIFPKTYAATKEKWEVGRIVCVVGRKSEEQGDNKIFVDKIEVVTPENVQFVRAQFASEPSKLSAHVPASVLGPTITIELPAGVDSVKQISLKELLQANPGDTRVYFSITINGTPRKIETGMKVRWDEELQRRVGEVIGP